MFFTPELIKLAQIAEKHGLPEDYVMIDYVRPLLSNETSRYPVLLNENGNAQRRIYLPEREAGACEAWLQMEAEIKWYSQLLANKRF
ncbi:hypothetical protein VEE76_23980 [Escherichia coli]|uniref:hypothetical protein n=1 Tax=Escherichia TaxID=561 RepID=UPI0005794430|nr:MULTISPECIES: hypothetical protein [Escherichia]EHL1440702.1 hypothetical protein [Escherichia coli]MXC80276.1 hypothetical protein [Escherichia sp. HH26CH]BEC37317.1 hypothetical protein VEE76_23980 [Escherichia coli]HBH7998793.1 hypothetical protein [Escherichia coli]HBH8045377.1 hypothetical protein [Escherichia coli]